MDKYEERRLALKALVDATGRGAIAAVAAAIEKDASYVSRMLYEPGKAGRKRIGEDSWDALVSAYPELTGEPAQPGARATSPSSAESDAVPPHETSPDYVRVEQLDAEAGMGGAVVNSDHPEVIRAVDFEPNYIRSIVGFVPASGRLVLVTGIGDSMLPTIQPGDVVVVDRGITSFDGDGLYLINMGNGHQIKRLIDKGVVHVASDNRDANGEPFPMPAGTLVGGRVYLRNRIERLS